VRIEDPTKFGEVIAMAGPTPNERQLTLVFGQEEKEFKLQKQPMVHLNWQTAFVDEDGKLKNDDDLYGFDARIADVVPPQDPKRDQAT
jgi:murein L,D-transpeptidase YcbB/YkuD